MTHAACILTFARLWIVVIARQVLWLLTKPEYRRRSFALFRKGQFFRTPFTIDLYKFRPILVSADHQHEVLTFRDRLYELQSLAYPPGYVVSTRWATDLNRAVEFCNRTTDARQIAFFGMSLLFDVGLPIANIGWLIESRARYIERYPELRAIGESPLVPAARVIDCDGVPFSHSIEQAFSYYSGLTDGTGDEAMNVVVEIGSGYGRFVRVLKLSGRSQRFILVDLPESLLFAFAFLRLHFPDARMRVLRSSQDCAHDIPGDYDFTFCPVQLLHHLRPARVDLVVNTYSLAEMQQGCVDHIMTQIDTHLRPRFLYSYNSVFTDKNLHYAESGNIGEGNEVVLKLQPQWWPVTFMLWNSQEDGAWRSEANTVLRRVTMPLDELTHKLIVAADASPSLSDKRLGYLYFAAFYTRDPSLREKFFS